MKRKILLYSLGIYLIILLQTTILDYFKIFNTKPNLILIFIISMALLRGSIEGAILGFLSGVIQDMFSGRAVGIYAIVGMYLGLLTGYANKRIYRENFIVMMTFTFATTVVYDLMILTPSIFKEGLLGYLAVLRPVLKEALYNSIVSIIIYILAIKLHFSMEDIKRTARKY